MDREHWRKMLPIIHAFVDGKTVLFKDAVLFKDDMFNGTLGFSCNPELYTIMEPPPPPKMVPLEQHDWLIGGPWWVLRDGRDDCYLVTAAYKDGRIRMDQCVMYSDALHDKCLRSATPADPNSWVRCEKPEAARADAAAPEAVAARAAALAEIDAAFVRAGHSPENKDCDHRQYDSTKHGRYCPCGSCMWDAGD